MKASTGFRTHAAFDTAGTGGRFTDFAGVPTIHSGSAFATNGRLHDAALSLFLSGAAPER